MALRAYHVKANPEPTMVDLEVPAGYEDDDFSPTAWLKCPENSAEASIQSVL
jgi:hypothetical protein